MLKRFHLHTLLGSLLLLILLVPEANAMPAFARDYKMSCATCHAAFPKLNEFGESFAASNFRLPNWKDNTVVTGDDMLALAKTPPVAFRAQAFAQARDAEAIDVSTGESTEVDSDFQSPYLIKILSSAPLSEHITYYFYAIFAEKGGNGETVVEDAWFSHDAVFGTDVSMMLGQFQVSDLMFPRETRLTFQDYMPYRMAGITYDRGVIFDTSAGPVDLAVGLVNGNGISENLTINSPGYQRSDHLFDNDTSKAVFGRIGGDIGPVSAGLFGYSGQQKNAITDVDNPAGTGSGNRQTDKNIVGLDFNGKLGNKTYWFAQALWNEWDGFINAGQNYEWFGGFVGIDYIHSPRWAHSLLYNYADAGDLENTDTIYEGIAMETLTYTASYYFMRNVKGVIEFNADLQSKVAQSGTYYTGHLTNENYFLVGFDAAF
ncbi:MAG: hypothetical protein SV201_03455 [Pseudomonadota bacterium]|nr:hypothetical protein [Pseudomonadota bacterium]